MRVALLAAMAFLGLEGCAAQNFSIRTVPPDTHSADNAAAVKSAASLATAAVGSPDLAARAAGAGNPLAADEALTPEEAPSMYTYDPLERVNRFTYRFNARFDEHVFLPVSYQYRRVPSPIRSGVHNFFGNLGEVKSVVNYVLQLRPIGGVHSLGRFVINSTAGIGGLFDVATRLKLRSDPTGFGTTLSKWGMHPGPYLVIPLLGPSTVRDGLGLLGDFGIEYAVNIADIYRGNKTWALGVVAAVDERSNTGFRYYATGSPFEYETIRFLYVHKALIEDEALRAKGPRPRTDNSIPAGR